MDDLLGDHTWVTDGGLETDLIFNRGVDLPEFAAFPLAADPEGRRTLLDYYTGYAAIARAARAGLLLESATWRASPDWAERLGYGPAALDAATREAVTVVREACEASGARHVLASGSVGPRGDGYRSGGTDADEAAEYHLPQVRAMAAAAADLVHAMTMTGAAEAIGVARAAREVGLPVAVSLTVETDGTLPDGQPLGEALAAVEAAAAPDWFGVNCAHPSHLLAGLDGGAWQQRIAFFRPNASTLSHAELDESEELDAGDLDLLAATTAQVRERTGGVRVLGGCCGTDARHVAALWDVASWAV
ncbi:homocysteine S-methyltransferase family protein [Nocardioides bruguierae]|uniref:Homocysteine S-methyltransferase family protein n=1 Tax=Nocardioides bruguierae TaxID=2945102 RepID=A0A9X2D4X5_9ACTN|nr:homocysteine S-methyltransferase family protein [Nocardioides bruguierae]MCM0619130.1 homocysteine S-methyltransferase family protein [Nocardioides bruguierae]